MGRAAVQPVNKGRVAALQQVIADHENSGPAVFIAKSDGLHTPGLYLRGDFQKIVNADPVGYLDAHSVKFGFVVVNGLPEVHPGKADTVDPAIFGIGFFKFRVGLFIPSPLEIFIGYIHHQPLIDILMKSFSGVGLGNIRPLSGLKSQTGLGL